MCLLILPGKGDDWDLKHDKLKGSHSDIACITEARSLCCSTEEKGSFRTEFKMTY